ncbi:MAG: class I SAM-dependent methyltransferase [Pirellulaceae bacterium]
MQTTQASIYDFPTYYDLVFGSDTAAEMRFLGQCFERFVSRKVQRVFEPACGTGRLIFRMGRKGYAVGGIDLNEKAVDFCNKRLEKYDIHGRAQVGDMSNFEVPKPFDACFNTINSFRHLGTEKAAVGHLQSVAAATRKGGIYALGMHLTPTEGEADDHESFNVKRGQLSINTDMWPIEKNPRKRVERFGIRFDIYSPSGTTRIEDVLVLRSYTANQFSKLIGAVPCWDLVEVYDFGYNIKRPIQIESTTQDIVAVLKKK